MQDTMIANILQYIFFSGKLARYFFGLELKVLKMMQRIFAMLFCIFTASAAYTNAALVCTNAGPTDNPAFCTAFKAAATCYCMDSGLPSVMCQDMNMLYGRLIAVFGTLEKACQHQKYTSPQDCVDSWKCYRFGGADSRGRLCSSTRTACQ